MADKEFLRRIAEIDLTQIARQLGLEVVKKGRLSKALCPFHDDHDPSLTFQEGKDGKWFYKCFACGAGGDGIDLTKHCRKCGFTEAVEFLAGLAGLAVPRVKGVTKEVSAHELAFNVFKKMAPSELERLKDWASTRKMSSAELVEHEVYFSVANKLSNHFQLQRKELDQLESSGLVNRNLRNHSTQLSSLPMEIPPRDFFYDDRVVFTIRSENDEIIGFAGRAVNPESKPKYLFTPSLPKSSLLYGLHRVRKKWTSNSSKKKDEPRVLYVVEGVMDAIRLSTKNLAAVAVLGSHLTDEQTRLLVNTAKQFQTSKGGLVIRIFFDRDSAGVLGTAKAVARLLTLQTDNETFSVEVIALQSIANDAGKIDPDSALAEFAIDEVSSHLEQFTCSPGHYLMAYGLGCDLSVIQEAWKDRSNAEKLRALRRIEALLTLEEWRKIVGCFGLDLFLTSTFRSSESLADNTWPSRFLQYLGRTEITTSVGDSKREDSNELLRALQVARSNAEKRELPQDDRSWQRLLLAYHVSIPYLQGLLRQGDCRIEPFLSMKLPKTSGGYRLKAMPCPEQLILQQYLLNELLKSYPQLASRFESAIPAIRYSEGRTTTTGIEQKTTDNVCFSYQVDMDIVSGQKQPGREGIFRPYIECWYSFVEYLSEKITVLENGIADSNSYHVARLDIRSYYDSLGRTAVTRVLYGAVREAIKSFRKPIDFAPLFKPSIVDADARVWEFIDTLCSQSFGYEYYDPQTGEVRLSSGGRSIGIPQGPALSAYLGTIALFPLDNAINHAVKSGKDGVAYARYVDDMVLIARSKVELDRLKSLVQIELGKIGLELSPKTDPLPVMNAAQIQSWLVANRGGANVSLMGQAIPIVNPETASEHFLDRNEVLSMLSDVDLFNPQVDRGSVFRVVQAVFRCTEARFEDQCRAWELCWRNFAEIVIEQQNSAGEKSIEEVASLSLEELCRELECVSLDGRIQDSNAVSHLAALRGLDKFFRSMRNKSCHFGESEQRTLANQLSSVAALVLSGLLTEIAKRLKSTEDENQFGIHLLELDIIELAVEVIYSSGLDSSAFDLSTVIGSSFNQISPKIRKRLSISAATQRTDLLDSLSAVARNSTDSHILLHEAITRLGIKKSRKSDELSNGLVQGGDPLLALEHSIVNISSAGSFDTLPAVLRSWLPNSSRDDLKQLPGELALGSLQAFMNIASEDLNILLRDRDALVQTALANFAQDDIEWLPLIPINTVHGFVGIRAKTNMLVSVLPKRNGDSESELVHTIHPTGLTWEKLQSSTSFLNALEANLSSYFVLKNVTLPKLPHRIGMWIAESFRNLANLPNADVEVPPNAANLLSTYSPSDLAPATSTLGFLVSRNEISGQAYVRMGRRGLIPIAVPIVGDALWRVGVTIADFLGITDDLRFNPIRNMHHTSGDSLFGPVSGDSEWAFRKLLLFSMLRLCGKTFNSSDCRYLNGIPRNIDRVLQRLSSFPSDDGDRQADREVAIVLATVFETRFAAARNSGSYVFAEVQQAGAALILLGKIAKNIVYADKSLAERLPKCGPIRGQWRRNVEVWFSFARRIGLLIDTVSDEDKAVSTPLLALANGLLVSALGEQLRCQALEIIASDNDLIELLVGLSPESIKLADVRLSGGELFAEAISSDRDKTHENRQVHLLLETLTRALRKDNRNYDRELSRITPLGWGLILAIVTGSVRSNIMLRFEPSSGDRSIACDAIQRVVDVLRSEGNFDNEEKIDLSDPWDGLESILNKKMFDDVVGAIKATDALDEMYSLVVSPLIRSPFLRIAQVHSPKNTDGDGNTLRQVRLNDSEFVFEPWRIATASAFNEIASGKIEAVQVGGNTTEFLWTETRRNGLPIGIHLAKPGIAALAGFESHVNEFKKEELKFSTLATKSSKPDSSDLEVLDSEIKKEQESHDSSTGDEYKGCNTESVESNVKEISAKPIESREEIAFLQELQLRSWSSRAKEHNSARNQIRVAFFQFQIEAYGSYRHPLFEVNQKSSECARQAERVLCESEIEFRRRAILEKVLLACKKFQVDCLLLPEYSMRPETVDWILRHIRERSVNTAVWAGTFRKPPFQTQPKWLEEIADWSSVLTVIIPNQKEVLYRCKKYPSIAFDEIFNPPSVPILPIVNSETHAAGAKITELICSEVFLASSPTNLIGLWETYSNLTRRFGRTARSKQDGLKYLFSDLAVFAESTSLTTNSDLRRSILFVPAMTPRSVDYVVLGQAGYLASGLTTVFCNDSGTGGHGQSCFVGHNGWDNDHGKLNDGVPGTGPYHGALPGIYRPFEHDRGWLGIHEQALVIADVDPTYQSEGKPRPQNLLPPLNLVAHLPLLEVREHPHESPIARDSGLPTLARPDDAILKLDWPFPGFWKKMSVTDFSSRKSVVDRILLKLSEYCRSLPSYSSTLDDDATRKVSGFLKALACATPENSGWLKKRAQYYEREAAANPQGFPPPTLLDWLYVDLSHSTSNPMIQVPPYAREPRSV